MRVPVWLTLGIAALVMIFGVYRLRLAMRVDSSDKPKKGLYAMGKRTHLLIGIVYLLLSAALVATSFGWNPFGDSFGSTAPPPKDKAPSTSVPIDGLQKK